MKTVGLAIAIGIASFLFTGSALTQTQENSCCSEKNTTTASSQQKSCCSDKNTTTVSAQKTSGSCCEGDCKDTKATQAQNSSKNQVVRCPVTNRVVRNLDKAPRIVYQGTTYYFANWNAFRTFRSNPARYAPQAQVRTVSATNQTQSCCADKTTTAETASKPSDKLLCPVSGEELEMASAVRFEYASKVYYTCCSSCKRKFLAEPETYAKKAEGMSALQGKPATTATN